MVCAYILKSTNLVSAIFKVKKEAQKVFTNNDMNIGKINLFVNIENSPYKINTCL